MPVFLLFFTMIADVSFVFHHQSNMLRIVQDANRALSTGRLACEAEAETFIETRLAALSASVDATTEITSGVIQTSVSVPIEYMTATPMFDFLSGYDIQVSGQHFIEY